jgi:ParB family chromosome partitioning protein
MPVEKIRVGPRHRRDLGDLDGLAASIEDIGLLNPITVDDTGLLLAGARRLAACKLLGWERAPVNFVRCGR